MSSDEDKAPPPKRTKKCSVRRKLAVLKEEVRQVQWRLEQMAAAVEDLEKELDE